MQVPQPSYSADRKGSINKIVIRGGGYNKAFSPDRNNYLKQELEKVWVSEKTTEPEGLPKFQSPRKSIEKKLTPFQREESKNYQIFCIGTRRISSLQDFTDS